jgi:transcriptional regulator with XRE-family HTH domain
VTRPGPWPQPATDTGGAAAGAAGRDRVNGAGRAREMRRDLGRRLRGLREAAGLSQQQVAKRAGYTRSAVSNAEAGGYARRRFWEMCDELFATGGMLACRYDEIHQRPPSQTGLARLELETGGPGLELLHGARDPALAALALAGYQKLGWPVEESRDGLVLVTGTMIDALEVTRPAGTLAAAWWLYTGGAADEVRGLPALPRPDRALAVVDAGPSVFFLAQAGGPWNARDVPARSFGRAGVPSVRWHCLGSRIPAPPSAAAGGQAAVWAHLPAARLRLAPAIGLLDLLAKAAATASRDAGRLAFPGGVVVIPVPGPPHAPLPAQ